MTPETRSGRGKNLVGSMLERRYRVDSLIARGGMSAVYRGLDTRLHRPVALKVMDDRYSGDRSFIDRFEREAQAAASLHHPHVVAVYDQGVDHGPEEDLIYLVMQLVEGCTLRDLLRDQGSLSLPVALSVLEPVLAALSAAHEAGMVHRDIKPENVLIGRDGSVLVTDFGLVRAAASAGTTSGSLILGTVAYLSPEQVTTGAADARSDIYAAGIVLYEMLTGSPPYTADTALSVAYRHVNDDVPAPSRQLSDLPSAIDSLVVRATRREASARPDSAETFLEELRQVRDQLDIPSAAVPIPASEQGTARTIPVDGSGPPTDQLAAVTSGDEPYQPEGPQGTRAMSRPEADEDRTQDLPAVTAAPTGTARSGSGSSRALAERGRDRRTVALWTVLVVVIAGLIGGAAWWVGLPNKVSVPRAVGKQEAVAINLVQGAGLDPKVNKEYDNTVPEGTVIRSSPDGGTEVTAGRTVDLVVSLGRPQVPEVSQGTSAKEAEKLLRDARLQPRRDPSVDQYHRSVPQGTVIGVDPSPGTRLEISSEVTLILSKGPPPVPVPDVRGASKQDAFAALRERGFEPYEAGRRFDPNVDQNHVVTTDPKPNTEIRLHGKPRVGVVFSTAITVPDFTGKSVQEAQQEASRLDLEIEIRSLLGNPQSPVLGQFPPAGNRVEPGSVVYITAL